MFLSVCAAAECLSADFFSNTYHYVINKYDINKGVLNFGCHAVRLNNDWFLTAAHCFLAVGDGEQKISFNGAPEVKAEVFVKDAFKNGFNNADDIALIKTDGGVPGLAKNVTLITVGDDYYDIQGMFSAALVTQKGAEVSCAEGGKYMAGSKDGMIENLYIGEGFSGGGIWDENGNLLGIISGGVNLTSGFAAFNADNLAFIKSHIPGLKTKPAKNAAVTP